MEGIWVIISTMLMCNARVRGWRRRSGLPIAPLHMDG